MRPVFCMAFALSLGACRAAPPASAVTRPAGVQALPAPAEFDDAWQPLSYGGYLAPVDPAAYASGTVDVIFHFHAGRAAEPEYRAGGARAAVVAITVDGLGTTPYWALMDDPHQFDRYKAALVKALSARAHRPMSIARIALVSFSAGYATVHRILAIQRHYDEVDAVVLLDGLHTGYVHNTNIAAPRRADLLPIAPFVRFANDAAAGRKLFVFTHSGIPTYNERYASTTEVADALALELGASWSTDPRPGPAGARRSADVGQVHLRGFSGEQARDHVVHDHMVGDVVRTWLIPRWR